jgi:Ca2+-binding RTX toxin-like protein
MGEFASIQRLVLYGGDGDDQIKVHHDLPPVPVEMYGGAGNDKLRGGQGTNVLVGGPGDDLISGGDDRDLLIGGDGRDKLIGDAGDDILIGGIYTEEENRAALWAVMAEWTSNNDYGVRVANLESETGTGLNGSYLLNDSTISDDNDRDTLKGKGGLDWFLADEDDDKTDLDLGEILTEIELDFVTSL